MSNDDKKEDDFFSKFGLEVTHGSVVVGETYPIYGMITKIVDETLGAVVVEINSNITAELAIDSLEKLEQIKQRAFEPGIFVSKIISNDPEIKVHVGTVVFGKRQGDAH